MWSGSAFDVVSFTRFGFRVFLGFRVLLGFFPKTREENSCFHVT
jgi:hypothetical protein